MDARQDLPISERELFAAVNREVYSARKPLIEEFFQKLGFWPDVACPKSFTEKILWRKVFDLNPAFGPLSDKLLSRDWMAKRWPGLKVARTIWVGDRAADIPDAALQGGVVLKINHASGCNIVLPRAPRNRAPIERQVDIWHSLHLARLHGEWAYGLVNRKIFVEKMLPDPPSDPLIDYNIFCCDGRVVFYVVTIGEKSTAEFVAAFLADGTRDFGMDAIHVYDKAFLLPSYRLSPLAEEALRAAAAISRGMDFARVDLMEAGGQLYAGEMTLYPGAGYGRYTFTRPAQEVGDMWDLRKSWFLNTPQTGMRAAYARALRNWLDRGSEINTHPSKSGAASAGAIRWR